MCIRKLLATLASQHSNVFIELVNFYKSLDKETFNGLKETYTDWFKKAFNKQFQPHIELILQKYYYQLYLNIDNFYFEKHVVITCQYI